MAIDINAFGVCANSYAGTGLGDCPIEEFGDFLGLGALNKGATLDVATDTMDEATFRSLITGGTMHQLIGSEVFEQNTPDNEVYTSSNGLKRDLRAGKPEFTITYMKGLCFHKAIYELQGNAKYDFIFYFDKGMLLAQNVDGSKLKGFDGGMFSVGTYKFLQGTDPEQGKAMLQLRSTEEFNTRWVYFPYDQLGFDASQIDGVVDVVASVVSTDSGATTVTMSVKDGCNSSVEYASLFDAVGDWKISVNGVDETISAVVITGGYAVLTVPTIGSTDNIVVSLNGIIEDESGKYYKSNNATAVVA